MHQEPELTEGVASPQDVARLKRMFSYANASQPELNDLAIRQMVAHFQRRPGDTGSSEVQSTSRCETHLPLLPFMRCVPVQSVYSRRVSTT